MRLAHRCAIFLCSLDVEIDDSLVGQLHKVRGDWEVTRQVNHSQVAQSSGNLTFEQKSGSSSCQSGMLSRI